MVDQDQFVLLLGGASGAGKTTAAIEISHRLSIPWLMVDDLRLAFQRSRVTLPTNTEALYFFTDIEERQQVWHESPERLRDSLLGILHGFRCCGAGLERHNGAWRLVAGAMDPGEYRQDRERWLLPRRTEISHVLEQLRYQKGLN